MIFRRLLGLCALLALLVSQTHTAWALCCAAAHGPAVVEATATDGAHAGHHLPAPAPTTHDHDPAPPCPQGPVGFMSGCAVAAALPVPAPSVADAPLAYDEPSLPTSSMPRLLLGEDLFHPPRA